VSTEIQVGNPKVMAKILHVVNAIPVNVKYYFSDFATHGKVGRKVCK
jgi:hypothetical protein